MRLREKASAALGMAKVRLLKQRIPVAVRVNLNNRCHSKCHYCSFWSTKSEELSTEQICALLSDLGKLGSRRVSFSGGEPMLRRDLGIIVRAAIDAGISPELNSSGFLFRERLENLRGLELVKLSFDGSEAVHDRLRGRAGSFREMLDAIDVLREEHIKFSFAFTMTKENLREIPYVLDFARQHDTFVAFQPVMATEHASENVENLYPDPEPYADAIQLLLREKERDPGRLRNSTSGLHHIASWPRIDGLACWAGDVFIVVEPNGNVVPCDRIRYDGAIPNLADGGIERALSLLPEKVCEGCGFCGSVELNMLMAGQVDIVPTILRVIR